MFSNTEYHELEQERNKAVELGERAAKAAEEALAHLLLANHRINRVRAILADLPEIDPDGEGPTRSQVEAMGQALIAINEAVTA